MGYDCSAKFRMACCKFPYCYGIYQYPSVFYKTCCPPAAIIPRCDTDWMVNHKYVKCNQYKVVDKEEPIGVVKQVIYDTIEETIWKSRLQRKCILYKETCTGYCALCCLTSLYETETRDGVSDINEDDNYYKHCVYYSVQLLYNLKLSDITGDKNFPPNILKKYLNPPQPFYLCRRETDFVVYYFTYKKSSTASKILEKYIYLAEPIPQKIFFVYHFKSPVYSQYTPEIQENIQEPPPNIYPPRSEYFQPNYPNIAEEPMDEANYYVPQQYYFEEPQLPSTYQNFKCEPILSEDSLEDEYDEEINRQLHETEDIIEEECERYVKLLKLDVDDNDDNERNRVHQSRLNYLKKKRDEETQKSIWVDIQGKESSNSKKLIKPKIKASTEPQVEQILRERLDLNSDPSKSQELYCAELFKDEPVVQKKITKKPRRPNSPKKLKTNKSLPANSPRNIKSSKPLELPKHSSIENKIDIPVESQQQSGYLSDEQSAYLSMTKQTEFQPSEYPSQEPQEYPVYPPIEPSGYPPIEPSGYQSPEYPPLGYEPSGYPPGVGYQLNIPGYPATTDLLGHPLMGHMTYTPVNVSAYPFEQPEPPNVEYETFTKFKIQNF